MTTLGRNVAANLAAALFTGLAMLAVGPLYLRWLGTEGYGLVGFQMTVQSLLILADLGFSLAINRELAALTGTPDGPLHARSLLRTALFAYWPAALALTGVMIAAAPFVATRWIEAPAESIPTVVSCLRLMAVALGAQFVSSLYTAGFLGLQRQVLYSGLSVSAVLLRFGGGALVAFLTGDVRLFFAWQAVAGVVQVAILAVALHRVLPGHRSTARFDPRWFRNAWALARGVALVTVLASITAQSDKLAVSRSSALAVFGLYTAASVLAMTAAGGAGPVSTAAFPRFTQLLAQGNQQELSLTYHRAVQTMSAIVLPVACVLALWSREVLFVWTGDPLLAEQARTVTALLVVGTAMNALLTVPYMLQLAHRWTRPATVMNAVALVTFVPAMFAAAVKVGPAGAAATFAAMHGVFLLCGVIVTQRHLLAGAGRWSFLRDTLPAALAASLIASAGRWLFPIGAGRMETVVALTIVGLGAFGGAVFITPAVREWIVGQWRMRRAAG